MPFYDFTCKVCGKRQEDVLVVSYRDIHVRCDAPDCEGVAERDFPIQAALGFMPFEAYYDEGLGCDIRTRNHRKQVMKILDVHEAGDRVGGALNFDAKAPHHVKPTAPRGISLPERRPEPWLVETEVAPGKWERVDTRDIR